MIWFYMQGESGVKKLKIALQTWAFNIVNGVINIVGMNFKFNISASMIKTIIYY